MGHGQSDNHNCAAHISFPRYQVQQGEKEKGGGAGDGGNGVNVKPRNGKKCGRNKSEYHSGDDHGTTSRAGGATPLPRIPIGPEPSTSSYLQPRRVSTDNDIYDSINEDADIDHGYRPQRAEEAKVDEKKKTGRIIFVR